MRTLLILLLSLLPQSTEPWTHQVDLEPMLRDAQMLQKLTIMYDSPLQQGFELLFVRGDGSLILQKYPARPMATADLPTCKEKVDQAKVRELIRLVVSKHFWELPEKRFLFIGGEPSHKELELHKIFISYGSEKASRVFGVGTYAGISNGVGRCKSFFLRCWPPQDTPVRWIPRAAVVDVRLLFTLRTQPMSLHLFRCCPPNIPSIMANHDELCELPGHPGRRVA